MIAGTIRNKIIESKDDEMRRNATPSKPKRVRLLATALVAASFLLVAAATRDETPRIPGAVTACPAWLKKGAPFDVEKFFATPAAAKNAAPLYLDAFAEFSPDVAACLPASQQSRTVVAKDRRTRLYAVYGDGNLGERSAALDRRAADALLGELHEGFRKFAAAQKRPQCVFATGISMDALLPHIQAAREVTRATHLRIFRDVENGDLERPIQDLAAILRMSRDLRYRSALLAQLFSSSVDGIVCLQILPILVGSPALKVEHCDRLLAVLKEHQAAGPDRFTTGAKGEYVMQRAVIHAFEDKREVRGGETGLPVEVALTKADLSKMLIQLCEQSSDQVPPAQIKDYTESILGRHGASWARERDVVSEYYKTLAAPDATVYHERVRRIEALRKAQVLGKDAELWLGRLIIPEYKLMALSMARGDLYVRASECLLAVRRWRLTHAGADPTDLALACKQAKLPGVPIDPFSNAPLKLAVVGGQPVVYSIGPDGVDDRALKDSNLGRKPDGDMLFRLPMATK